MMMIVLVTDCVGFGDRSGDDDDYDEDDDGANDDDDDDDGCGR